MRKLYEIFKILQNLKKNSFREYYSRKYSIFRDVFSELAGWALAMDLGGILGVQLTLFQLGGGQVMPTTLLHANPDLKT
jgi:hypothetical protein